MSNPLVGRPSPSMAPPSLPPSAYVRPVPPESDSQPDESKSTAGNNLLSRSLNPPPSPNPAIHRVSFNQDFGCFAVGLDTGFRTYLCDPFVPRYRQDFDSGRGSGGGSGLGLVAMLFRTNLYCLVGGGPNPLFPLNKVLIWDDQARQCRGELSFRSEVKSVKLRRDRIVVITFQKVFVYNFMDFRLLHQIETAVNAKGLCEVSQAATPMLLVCPGAVKGQIRVEDFGSKRTRFVTAHDSSIACLAMTLDGRFFATASSKGTLIRVFNTLDGSLLQELRRGADRADIFSLAFSSNAQWLAVSSDKGTVHVFNLKVDSGSLANDRSHASSESNHSTSLRSLSIFKGVLPKYFKSEWSVAQFRLPEGLQYFVGFQQKNIIVIVGMDGSFYRCEFDPLNGGEMTQLEHHNFMNASNFLKP